MIGAVPPRLLPLDSRRSQALTAGLLVCGCVATLFLDPDHPVGFEVCAFRRLTGLPCMTCGLTRSLCHVLRGDWARSLDYHPAGPLLMVALLGWALWVGAEAAMGARWREDLRLRLRNHFLTWGMAVSVVSWIVRLASGTAP